MSFTTKPKFKQLDKISFKPLMNWVKGDRLPAEMVHLDDGLKADAIELRAAGHCTLNDKQYEFHDIRVYVDKVRL